MASDTQMIEDSHTSLPVVLPTRRQTLKQRSDLGDLVHASVNARERVGLVVDNDCQLQGVEDRNVMSAHRVILAQRRRRESSAEWLLAILVRGVCVSEGIAAGGNKLLPVRKAFSQ